MKKQVKTLVTCAIVFILLIGGVIAAMSWEGKQEEEDLTQAAIPLITTDRNQISQVSLETEDERIELVAKGEDGDFTVKGLEGAPLSKLTIDNVMNTIINLEAVQKVEAAEPIDLAMYGLDDPDVKLRLTLKDGKAFELAIGDDTPSYTGSYALFNEQLYIVGSSTAMSLEKTLYDFVDDQIVPLKDSDAYVEKVLLKNEGKPEIQLTYIPEETVTTEKEEIEEADEIGATNAEDEPDTTETDTEADKDTEEDTEPEETVIPAYYKMTLPYEKDLTTYDVTAWTDGIFGMYADRVETVDISEEERRSFGFDEPISVIEITTSNEQTYKLTVSEHNDNYYILCNDSTVLYSVGKEDLTWLDITPETLSKSIFGNTNSEDIARLHIQTDKEAFNIAPGENNVTSEGFKEISQLIVSFPITKVPPVETFSLDTAAVITISYKDGKTDTLELIPTGSGELYMVLNGVCEYTTGEWGLTTLIDKSLSLNEVPEEE